MCSAKGAYRFTRGRNGSQAFLPRKILGSTKQVLEDNDCTQRRADAYDPIAGHEIRGNRDTPGNRSEKEKNKKSRPFKRAPGLGVDIGLMATNGAYPAFPKPERQEWYPKNVSGVKRAYL
ncbi:MAG: hypothetical protein PVS2B2_15880 [Candidatus Acidiferrum sp.]